MSIGGDTARKAQPNRGTKTIAIITGPTREAALVDLNSWRTFDLEANKEVVIFDGGREDRHEKTFVRVVLIDWASRVEIEGFVVDEGGCIEPVPAQDDIPQILVVGDSISAGYAVAVDDGGERIPFGCLNTFPFVAQRTLLSRGVPGAREVGVDMIAYPGLCLVHPTEKEKEAGFHPGMVEAFFWESIWNSYPSAEAHVSSPAVVMIQLGNNDQSFKISPERFGDALVGLVEALQKRSPDSIRHVWLVPPFPDADVPDYKEINKAMRTYVETLNERFGDMICCRICDLADGLITEDTVDGAHPSLRVHKKIGQNLAEFIERNLFGNA